MYEFKTIPLKTLPAVLPTSVVVGLDGSVNAEQALGWAADEARIRRRPLQIVHIGEPGLFSRDVLADALATVAGMQPGLAASAVPMRGDPVAQLLRLSASANLLVLGRSRHGVLGTPLGSVTASVLAHAHCPTVIIPRVSHGHGRQIVVGISDSPGGLAALRFAFAEAHRRGTGVIAVRSWWAHEWRFGSEHAVPMDEPRLWLEPERAVLDQCVTQVRGEFPAIPVRSVLTGQEADLAFDGLTREAALLVLGCRRGDDARIARLGPITTWATRHIDYPVVVVGHPTHLARQPEVPGSVAAPAEQRVLARSA